MKENKNNFALIVLCGLLVGIITGCSQNTQLSLAKLKSDPEYPQWLTPVETDLEDSIWEEYRAGRTSYENLRLTLRKYHYLLKTYPDSDRVPFWLYMSTRFYLALDYDHLAYAAAEKLLALPEDRVCVTDWKSMPNLAAYQQDVKAFILRILARQQLKDAFSARIENFSPQKSSQYLELAQAYLLLDDRQNALAMLDQTLVDTNLPNRHKKSSFTAGACALAYSMGELDKVKQYSQWMIDLGEHSKELIPGDTKSTYYQNQWQSCYQIVAYFREWAENGKKITLSDLKDGQYGGAMRGFIDLIDVTVKVEKGSIAELTAINHREDRPFSAIEIIPQRILQREKLEVDVITGATVTSAAILAAGWQALSKAAD